jgi:Divergent InlB B-repeat domain
VRRGRVVLAAGGFAATIVVSLAFVSSAPSAASNASARPTLVVAVTGKGKVTSAPSGISCPRKCRASFRLGTTVRLRPHAASGWKFARWLGACRSKATPCSVTLASSKAVRAVFRLLPVPKPPPPPPPPGSSRTNPLLLGQPVTLVAGSDRWQFRILSVQPDATAQVLAENQFNDPPQPGFQFYMAAVEVTYVAGPAPQNPYFRIASQLKTVGDSNVSYTQYNPGCGVTPDDLLLKATDLFPGGAITGNICWSVRSTDAPSLVAFFELSTGLFWMALR